MGMKLSSGCEKFHKILLRVTPQFQLRGSCNETLRPLRALSTLATDGHRVTVR